MGQALEEGEEGENYMPVSDEQLERDRRRAHENLWADDDAEYYNSGKHGVCTLPTGLC